MIVKKRTLDTTALEELLRVLLPPKIHHPPDPLDPPLVPPEPPLPRLKSSTSSKTVSWLLSSISTSPLLNVFGWESSFLWTSLLARFEPIDSIGTTAQVENLMNNKKRTVFKRMSIWFAKQFETEVFYELFSLLSKSSNEIRNILIWTRHRCSW